MELKIETIIAKIKNFFIEKPKGNIWKRITIYLVLLKYFGVAILFFSIPFLAGLLIPNQDIDFSEISNMVSEALTSSMELVYKIGSNLATDNPILSKIIAFATAHIIWVYWAGIIILILDITRHISSMIFSKEINKRRIPTRRWRL